MGQRQHGFCQGFASLSFIVRSCSGVSTGRWPIYLVFHMFCLLSGEGKAIETYVCGCNYALWLLWVRVSPASSFLCFRQGCPIMGRPAGRLQQSQQALCQQPAALERQHSSWGQ